MPSGKAHFLINCIGFLPLVYSALTYAPAGDGPPLLIGFAVTTLCLSPDLDLNEPGFTLLTLRRQLGLPGYLFGLYWWPYSRLSSHRGLSHSLLAGTLTRWLYLLPLAFGIYYALTQNNVAVPLPSPQEWTLLFAGSWLADALHIIADRTVTSVKRARYRSTRRSGAIPIERLSKSRPNERSLQDLHGTRR